MKVLGFGRDSLPAEIMTSVQGLLDRTAEDKLLRKIATVIN